MPPNVLGYSARNTARRVDLHVFAFRRAYGSHSCLKMCLDILRENPSAPESSYKRHHRNGDVLVSTVSHHQCVGPTYCITGVCARVCTSLHYNHRCYTRSVIGICLDSNQDKLGALLFFFFGLNLRCGFHKPLDR